MVEKLLDGIEWQKIATVGEAYGHKIDIEAERARVKNLVLHRIAQGNGISCLQFRDVGRWRAETSEDYTIVELLLTASGVNSCEPG